jgi:hypothetical protein
MGKVGERACLDPFLRRIIREESQKPSRWGKLIRRKKEVDNTFLRLFVMIKKEELLFMESNDYVSLHEHIRAHCHQKQWYGPDIYQNHSTFNRHPHGPWIRHDFRTSFFPSAIEEQLCLSEEAMGFPYPPALRMLYSQLANGGFGPVHGLVGAFCGYADSLHKEKQHTYLLQESVVSSAFPKGTDFLDLEQYEVLST